MKTQGIALSYNSFPERLLLVLLSNMVHILIFDSAMADLYRFWLVLLSLSNFSDLSITYDSRSQSNQANARTQNNQRLELVANPLYVALTFKEIFHIISVILVSICSKLSLKES